MGGFIIGMWVFTFVDFNGECGIPIFNWLAVHVSLFAFNTIFKLFMIIVVKTCPRHRMVLELVMPFIVYVVMIGWLLYGNMLFYSPDNNCGE